MAVVSVVPSLSAVIVEARQWHGKRIQCIHGGAWLFRPKPCGTLDYAYDRVFTGTVQSVTQISDTDRRLDITPDEVFLGESTSPVSTTVNQACLTPNDPEIKAGDKWLFYLRKYRAFRTDGQPIYASVQFQMPFDGPSKPLSQAQESIAELRHLGHLSDSGILSGDVRAPYTGTIDGVPNHKIVAKRLSNGAQYSTITDSSGEFKFDPLPAGIYSVTANTSDGLWAREGKLEVHSGKCTSIGFELATDGVISGHVGSPDGKPFTVHPWVQIVSVDANRFMSAYVDANGYFEARGVEPGRYIVGLGIQSRTGAPSLPSPVYYPGVRTKEQATIIQLGRAEKRTGIDFQLPPGDVLKPLWACSESLMPRCPSLPAFCAGGQPELRSIPLPILLSRQPRTVVSSTHQ
ncbi:MAG TPA: carboxypeptidase-like regulatory domain-containing protein [Candidatus Sulfotelmatobacter sp.]|nr:carboxypeptidase-like regulatory domain-containing protein [Candidatus Sulfotelmatobacter sp.]